MGVPTFPYRVTVFQGKPGCHPEQRNFETLTEAITFRERALRKGGTQKTELAMVLDETSAAHGEALNLEVRLHRGVDLHGRKPGVIR